MSSRDHSERPRVIEAGVAALACLAVAAVSFGSFRAGFPIDDAWIHMVYGAALRDEGSLAYNAGVPATGCTSPLWALLGGLAHLASGQPTPSPRAVVWVKLFGAAAHVASAVLAARLARACAPLGCSRDASALAAGALVAALPALAFSAVSGMEVSLASALMLGALVAGVRDRHALAGLLAGLAVVARPECALAVAAVVALAALRSAARRPALVAAAAAGAPIALLVARTLAASGRPLPATFYAKASFAASGVPAALRGAALTVAAAMPSGLTLLGLLVAVSLACGARAAVLHLRGRRPDALLPAVTGGAASLLGLAYIVGASLSIRLEIPEHFYFQRYVLPGLPLLAVGVAHGASCAFERALAALPGRGPALRAAALAALAVALAACAAATPGARRSYREAVANVDAVQVATGRWAASSLPPDGVLWSVDAGAVRYWGRRRVVDAMGLNTPELVVGGHVPLAWSADAVVVVPRYFAPASTPGRLRRALRVQSPFADYASRRGPYVQMIFRCVDPQPTGLDALSLVDRRTQAPFLLGRCRRR